MDITNLFPSWDTIKDFIITFGWVKGTLTLLFWVFHIWIYKLYNDRLKDRQAEINRLAQDNREYRERFLAVLDKHFDYQVPIKPPPTLPPPPKETILVNKRNNQDESKKTPAIAKSKNNDKEKKKRG